ncbi:MAG: hypothetical protein KGS61_07755 [Verrucomicrobia bacterium]|nr:hypothetical protein [Verrucomicrobiota bacterium]
MTRPQFQPEQARVIARAFETAGVDYLFIGKGGAVLLGFPAMTQDVDVFAERSPENGRRIVNALRAVGFALGPEIEQAIVSGKDFVQIKTGPFDLDLVFAPDGIPSFAAAKARALRVEGFRIANLRDIIASKRASGREKDLLDLEYLERFREEYEKQHAPRLRSALGAARKREHDKGEARGGNGRRRE